MLSHTLWICKFFCDFWIFAELHTIISNILHQDSLQADIITHFKLVQIKIRLS